MASLDVQLVVRLALVLVDLVVELATVVSVEEEVLEGIPKLGIVGCGGIEEERVGVAIEDVELEEVAQALVFGSILGCSMLAVLALVQVLVSDSILGCSMLAVLAPALVVALPMVEVLECVVLALVLVGVSGSILGYSIQALVLARVGVPILDCFPILVKPQAQALVLAVACSMGS